MTSAEQNFVQKLDQFQLAWVELSNAWEDLDREAFDRANDTDKQSYPFGQSFDDMVVPVMQWVVNVKKSLFGNVPQITTKDIERVMSELTPLMSKSAPMSVHGMLQQANQHLHRAKLNVNTNNQ